MTADVYQLIAILLGVGATITTLEFLSIRREFDVDGIYTWRILQLEVPYRLRSAGMATRLGLVYGRRGTVAVLTIRLVSALAVIAVPVGSTGAALALGLLVITTLILTARQDYGQNGADQMTSIIAVTLLLATGIWSTPFTREAGLWFIALQACLAYLAAGTAKLVSPTWRSGVAVGLIVSCGAYGTQSVATFFATRPYWSAILSWATMIFEVMFPLSLVVPEPAVWLVLCAGVAFHLSIAVIMGLNDFFWAFIAPYPAVYYVSMQVRGALA